MSSAPITDSVSDPRNPFGLPLGSVRAVMALAVGAFFWVVLLYPGEPAAVRPPLGHFFLLALVLMAFSPHTGAKGENGSSFMPWLLRLAFIGVTAAVVAWVVTQYPGRLAVRLTPDPDELKRWWLVFLGCTAGGFVAGLMLHLVLGNGAAFRAGRSWLSVAGVVMLTLEIGLFLMNIASQTQADFLHYWDAVELIVVAAYFGTRA